MASHAESGSEYIRSVEDVHSMTTKQCMTCKKEFTSQRKIAKYCSDRCRYHEFLTKKKRVNIPSDMRYSVLMRDGFRCQYCGDTPDKKRLRVDHIVSIADGGARTAMSNLITACDPCNAGKGERSVDPDTLTWAPINNRNA